MRVGEVVEQDVTAPGGEIRVVAARKRSARHEWRHLAIERYLTCARRLQASIAPATRGLQEQACRRCRRCVRGVFETEGLDRREERRAGWGCVDSRHSPAWEDPARAQPLGELLETAILDAGDDHGPGSIAPWHERVLRAPATADDEGLADGAAANR